MKNQLKRLWLVAVIVTAATLLTSALGGWTGIASATGTYDCCCNNCLACDRKTTCDADTMLFAECTDTRYSTCCKDACGFD